MTLLTLRESKTEIIHKTQSRLEKRGNGGNPEERKKRCSAKNLHRKNRRQEGKRKRD